MPIEPWLNGPLTGVSPLLMPAAHALLQAQNDIEHYAGELTTEQVWAEPNDIPSVGFHLRHIDGSSDRLLTYAKGETLSEAQFAFLKAERNPTDPKPSATQLIEAVNNRIAILMRFIQTTPDDVLFEARFVGRAKLQTNVIGLIFHIAEHMQRHVGSIIVVAKIVRQ